MSNLIHECNSPQHFVVNIQIFQSESNSKIVHVSRNENGFAPFGGAGTVVVRIMQWGERPPFPSKCGQRRETRERDRTVSVRC